MSVKLRHSQSGYFYAGPRRWVPEAREARDLQSLERAIEVGRRPEFRGVELEACVGDRNCEWVLSLRPGETRHREVLRSESWISRKRWHPPSKPTQAASERALP